MRVQSKDAAFEERVTISGSDNSDGSFPGTPGVMIPAIRGDEWAVELEWSSDGGATWYPSAIRRTDGVTDADGLVVVLGADDNVPAARDNDFNDLVVQFVYLDQAANPPPPAKPYDFTIPRDWLRRAEPDRPPGDSTPPTGPG